MKYDFVTSLGVTDNLLYQCAGSLTRKRETWILVSTININKRDFCSSHVHKLLWFICINVICSVYIACYTLSYHQICPYSNIVTVLHHSSGTQIMAQACCNISRHIMLSHNGTLGIDVPMYNHLLIEQPQHQGLNIILIPHRPDD